MRYLLINILFLVSINVLAGTGIIITRESPIFIKPSIKSDILQKKKKGEKIYIHESHFTKEIYKDYFNKNNLYFSENLPSEHDKKSDETIYSQEFYRTTDDYGNDGFIPKRYVKLVYGDEREKNKHIKPFKNDPTGINEKEVAEKDYPFYVHNKMRGGLDIGLITNPQSHYNHPYEISESDQSLNIDIQAHYEIKPSYEWADDLFIGGSVVFNQYKNAIILKNNDYAEENRIRFGIGPFLSYGLFENNKYDFDIFLSPYLNLINQVSVDKSTSDGSHEKKYFYTTNFSTRVGFSLAKKNLFNETGIILKLYSEIFPPYTLKNNDNETSNKKEYWPTNQIKSPIETVFGISIGIQSF